jgi:hypothetical protein
MTAEINVIGMRIRRICSAVTLLHFPLQGEMSEIDRADIIRSFYNLWEFIYQLIRI